MLNWLLGRGRRQKTPWSEAVRRCSRGMPPDPAQTVLQTVLASGARRGIAAHPELTTSTERIERLVPRRRGRGPEGSPLTPLAPAWCLRPCDVPPPSPWRASFRFWRPALAVPSRPLPPRWVARGAPAPVPEGSGGGHPRPLSRSGPCPVVQMCRRRCRFQGVYCGALIGALLAGPTGSLELRLTAGRAATPRGGALRPSACPGSMLLALTILRLSFPYLLAILAVEAHRNARGEQCAS